MKKIFILSIILIMSTIISFSTMMQIVNLPIATASSQVEPEGEYDIHGMLCNANKLKKDG